MADRFMNGFVAGMIDYLPALLIDKAATLLKLEKTDFMDFVAALMFQGKIDSPFRMIFAFWVQLIYAGFMGVIFVYLFQVVTPRYYYIKGALLGILTWFTIYTIDILFKIPDMVTIDFAAAVPHHISSIAWGIGTAVIIRYFEKKSQAHI